MHEPMIGASAYATADAELLREAGIGWVRLDFGFPFSGRIGAEVTEQYALQKADAAGLAAKGIGVMGVTPLPGIAVHRPDAQGQLALQWQDWLPAWCGPLGSDECLKAYEEACAWLADDLRRFVRAWQVANELDIEQFAGPLSPRQAAHLILHGARGLKSADASLIVGPNAAGSDKAYYLFGHLYGTNSGLLDYCGIDGYYGTWAPGGPDKWAERIGELHALTGAPVLINEWGFSSAGRLMTQKERRAGLPVCQLRKWAYKWGRGHTRKGQAEFVQAAFDAFCTQREALLGVFFYRWEDQERCWQCGAPDCPAETAWGLVDRNGRPKPSFHTFKEGVQRLLA